MIRKAWMFAALLLVSLAISPLTAQQYGPPATGNTSAVLFVPGTVNLVAGLNGEGFGGDGGPANSAATQFNFPAGVAYDTNGNLFIADSMNHVVRRIDHVTGDISTYAGQQANYGFSPATGTAPAASAQLGYDLSGLIIDSNNNIYFGDTSNSVVWKITSAGIISVFAGGGASPATCTGSTNSIGDGCLATAAVLEVPEGLALDASGNLYIADAHAFVVREVSASTGKISTFAGNVGDSYFSGCPAVLYTTSTPPYTPTQAHLCFPYGVGFDSIGNFYVTESQRFMVRVVTKSTGNISTFAGGGSGTCTGATDTLGDGCPATDAILDYPAGLYVDPANRVYFVDFEGGGIRMVDNSGNISVVLGDNGELVKKSIGYPDTEEVLINGEPVGAATGIDFFTMDPYGDLVPVDADSAAATSSGSSGGYYFPETTIYTTTTTTSAHAATTFAPPYILITNPSGVPLNLEADPVITGPFGIVSGAGAGTCTFPGTVAPGASCTIVASFTPTVGGFPGTLNTGTISIATNAGSSPSVINLQGMSDGNPTPAATLTPNPVPAFASAVGVTSAAQQVTLTNTGTAPLIIGSTDFDGGSPTDFGVAGTNCPISPATLAVGASCVYQITFTPSAAMPYEAGFQVDIEYYSGSTLENFGFFSTSLSGTGTGSVTLTNVAFGNVVVGQASAVMSATLTNGNATPITGITPSITGANPSDFALATGANACGATLAGGGATCSIYLTFTPASAISFTAALQVAVTGGTAPQNATLTGMGTAPSALLSPATVPFGSLNFGTVSAPMPLTLSNTGSAPMTISGITIAGTNPTDFAISTGANACGATLAANSNCSIYVTFNPASAASFTATLQVADNATGSPQTSALTGTGTAPAAPVASLTPATVPFGSLTAGTTSAPMQLVLTNTGNATLVIGGISIGGTNPGDFALSTGANPCATRLEAGASCSIYVTFTPASAASFTATLEVADNAAGSPQTSTLTGTGTPPPAPAVTLAPNSVAFASQTIGVTSAATTVTLTNSGNATLTITGISIAGTNPTDFAMTSGSSPCGGTLAAGASCTVSVTFTPSAAGSFSATLSIANNAAGSPQTVALSGTGINPADFTVSATPATQTVLPGGSTTYAVTVASINGTFTNPVALTVSGLPAGATGTFSSPSVTPGASGAPSTLTVQTSTSTQQTARNSAWPLAAPVLAAVGLFFLPGKRRRRWIGLGMLLLVSLGTLTALSGCGGGFRFIQPPQTYTLSITGTSGDDTHSTTVQLTVE